MIEQPARMISLAVSGLAVLVLAGCSAPQPGPIVVPDPHGYEALPVDVGDTFTDGFEIIYVLDDRPVTITNIELINSPEQLELVDVQLAGGARSANIQFDPVFPPTSFDMGPLAPAIGATLLPVSQQNTEINGYELLMGIKVTEPGKWVRGAYRFEYTIDGVAYAWDAVAEITICTPDFLEDDGSCPMHYP